MKNSSLSCLIFVSLFGCTTSCTTKTIEPQSKRGPAQTAVSESVVGNETAQPIDEDRLTEDTDPQPAQPYDLEFHSDQWVDKAGNFRTFDLVGPYSNSAGAPLSKFLNLAKKSIDIEIYEMTDSETQDGLNHALLPGSQVKIRVIEEPKAVGHKCNVWADSTDNPACQREQDLRLNIVNSGGQFVPFNKDTLCGQSPNSKQRPCFQHGKIVVVDRQYALISTGNFNGTNLCDIEDSPKVCNRDYTYVTRDPSVVGALEEIFEADLIGVRPDIPQILKKHRVVKKLTVSPFSLEPLSKLLHQAKYSIQIQNQYIYPNSGLDVVLKDIAENSDVRMEIQVAHICSFGRVTQNDSLAAKKALFDELEGWNEPDVTPKRIEVRTFPKSEKVIDKFGNDHESYLHAKAIVIDAGHPGAKAWIGSVNGSQSSVSINREYGIVFTNPARVAELASYMHNDFIDDASLGYVKSFECAGKASPRKRRHKN